MHLLKRIGLITLGLILLFPVGKSRVQANAPLSAPTVTARHALIQNRETGRILYEKSAGTRVPMASTTKIMTAILVIKNCSLTDNVTVSQQASAISGSTMHLAQGETISVRSLLYGLLICSGNDAAVALAEHTAGTVEAFADRMNQEAQQMGLTDTHFTSPHGLDDPGHYTTAYDLAQMADAFMAYPELTKIAATKQIAVEGHNLTNTNPLLGVNEHVTGLKTGYTGNAGYCLVLSAAQGDATYLIILLNAPTSKARKKDAQTLTAFATENYALYNIFPKNYGVTTLPVQKGDIDQVDAVLPEGLQLVLTKEERDNLTINFTPYQDCLRAPVACGAALGKFRAFSGKMCLYEAEAVSLQSVGERSFWANFLAILTAWVYLFS